MSYDFSNEDEIVKLLDRKQATIELFSRKIKDLQQDALRWRALMSCQRIRVLGSAGLGSTEYQHMGLELWTKHMDVDQERHLASVKDLEIFVDTIVASKEQG